MRSPGERERAAALESSAPGEIAGKTVFLLVAVALNLLELFLPRIPLFPWLKPGLSNCVTIAWIVKYGALDALLFSLLRIWISGFYVGFSFVTISLSLGGGVAATLVMGLLWHTAGRRGVLGLVGIGIAGALFHNLGQLAAVYVLMAGNPALFLQMPAMIGASIVFGGVVGACAPLLLRLAEATPALARHEPAAPSMDLDVRRYHAAISAAILLLSIALVFVARLDALCVIAVTVTAAVQVMLRGSAAALAAPLRRFWLLFVFVAALYLLFSYGKRVEWLPFVTYEGAHETAAQWLRLFTWLQLSFVLTRVRFHTVVFSALGRAFPGRRGTLYAGLLAVEYFPRVAGLIRAGARVNARDWARHPLLSARETVRGSYGAIVAFVSGERGAVA